VRHLEHAHALADLFTGIAQGLPLESHISVDPSFFKTEFQPPPGSLFKQAALTAYITRKREEITKFKTPKPGSFSKFLDKAIINELPNLNSELSYIPPCPVEVALSRAVFRGAFSHIDEEIDQLIQHVAQRSGFCDHVIEFALSKIRNCESRSSQEQSVGLMILFRIVYDRLYEKKWRTVMPPDDSITDTIIQASRLPVKVFHFPYDAPFTMFRDMEVREYFLTQFSRDNPDMFLSELMFLTNPLDCLFCVHRSITSINCALVTTHIGSRREVTAQDLRQVMNFDDMFSLLIGILLASDVPEFVTIAEYVGRFGPQQALSCSFLYARASLSALVSHFRSLNVEALRSEATEPDRAQAQ
jgi:hypothetical protein